MIEASSTNGDGPLALHCIGVHFRGLPATVRDHLSLTPDGVSEALATIATTMPGAEAVVLATCNRTELYVVEAGDPVRLDLWHRTVGRRLPEDGCPAGMAARFHLRGAAVADHLLRVVTGLDSMALGDTGIAGQVRRARASAHAAGTVGPILHRLFDVAAGVGRRARTETAISDGGAGVGLATTNAVLDHLAPASGARPSVIVIGAGDAGQAICRDLTKRTDASITIVNRDVARARRLAAIHGARAAPLDELASVLHGADVVVTAIHGASPVLDAELVRRVRETDPAWSPLVVDTCVPRMVADLEDLQVVHLDDEASRSEAVADVRAAAIPEVEAIVAEGAEDFATWFRERSLADVIAALFREAEDVTRSTVALVDDERTAREIHRAVRRLVHHHITRLRALDGPVDVRPRKDSHR